MWVVSLGRRQPRMPEDLLHYADLNALLETGREHCSNPVNASAATDGAWGIRHG
jgi:hypothetical protein